MAERLDLEAEDMLYMWMIFLGLLNLLTESQSIP